MRIWIAAGLLLSLVVLSSGQTGSSGSKKKKSIAEELEALRQEHREKAEKLTRQLEKIQAELEQLEERTLARYATLVRKNAADPGVYAALEFLIFSETAHSGLAQDIVLKHHLTSPRLGRLCLFLVDGEEVNAPRTEKLLRAAIKKNPHANVQGLARFALARLLVARNETESLPLPERIAAREEALKLLEVVVKKYPRLKTPATEEEEAGLVIEQARPMLFELSRLLPGKTVPELKGKGLDGKALALSDFRGKVLLLYFWSFDTPACGEMLPQLKALLNRQAGKPFAMVGVNDDEEAELREHLKKERIPWRSLPNNRKDQESISTQWNLKGWPTLYLIDHKGVIRQRWLDNPGAKVLDRAVDALVAEAK